MLKVYLLDDEQHAIDGLLAMIKKKFNENVIVVGSNCKVSIAIDEIEELQPDVVFLDVEMPEMNGWDVLKHFPERRFQIVFTTAYEKYALPALKIEATDYLVKPISPSDMSAAISKCITKCNQTIDNVNTKEKITLSTAHELIIANIEDIIRIEADNNYSFFYFINRPKIMVSKTLKEFEYLSSKGFFRVHQSHLINMAHVLSINNYEGEKIAMVNGHTVDVSRRKKTDFLKKLKSL